ncbi:MAG: DMT family transporter [Acidobacteria bacterium]|nr:DMT family transporter [Acidobacteriota bacterium]
MRKFELADILGLVVVLLWAANLPLAKDALREFSPMSFNAVRIPLSALLLWIPMLLLKRRIHLQPRDIWKILVLGIIGNVFYLTLFIHGLELTKAGNVGLLMSVGTVFTAFLSRLLGHEYLGRTVWGGIFLSFGGVAVILIESAEFAVGTGTLVGDLITLAAACCWSVYTVFSKTLMKSYSPLTFTTLTLSVGACALFFISLPDLVDQNWGQISTKSYLELGYSCIFSLAVAYSIWFYCVDRLGSTKTAIYANLVPFWTLLFAWFFIGEEITLLQILGGILILSGIYLTKLKKAAGDPRITRM